MVNRHVLLTGAALLTLFLGFLLHACAGGGGANNSGVKAEGLVAPAADTRTGTHNNYDSQFREQTRSTAQSYGKGGQLDEEARAMLGSSGWGKPRNVNSEPDIGQDPVDGALGVSGTPGMAEKIESWFVPKAYAQDHGLDERYLVRTGDMSTGVEDYRDAQASVETIAAKYDGMVTDSQSRKNSDGTVSGWIRLRVPNEQFFNAWADLLEIGEVTEQSTTSEDVSQTYVGYVSRLKNLNEEQAVLQDMLAEAREVQKTRGLGEAYSVLLQTQERLSDVTGEIQSTEDRLNALADRVTRSTITVNLTEKKKLPAQVKEQFTWGLSETAGQGFRDLKITVRNSLQGITYFLITCWTWLIPWAIVIFFGVKAWKRWIAPRLKGSFALKEKNIESKDGS